MIGAKENQEPSTLNVIWPVHSVLYSVSQVKFGVINMLSKWVLHIMFFAS